MQNVITITQDHDKQLREAVIRQIDWDPEIGSDDITVSAANGVVTLTGFVHTFAEKYAAEKTAQRVYGVKAIANDIEVKPLTAHTDPEIARDVVNAMKINVTVPDDMVKAVVDQGWVTLEGDVDWDFQRRSAESCARNIAGVRGVVNNLKIKPRISARLVSEKIQDALRRSAEVDARRIHVSVSDSTVRLDGSVRSWAERREAEHAAWSAPGVAHVVDHIAIVP